MGFDVLELPSRIFGYISKIQTAQDYMFKLLLDILCGESILDFSNIMHLYLFSSGMSVLGTDCTFHCDITVIKNKVQQYASDDSHRTESVSD